LRRWRIGRSSSVACIAPGATVDYTSENLRAVESYYETIPEAAAYNAVARVSDCGLRQRDPAPHAVGERKRKQQDINT